MEATGSTLAPYGAFALAAMRGDSETAIDLVEATLKDATARGEGSTFAIGEWANALLHNSLGSYEEALAAARRATSYAPDPGSTIWPLVELVEAGARLGEVDLAQDALKRLSDMTSESGTNWALGLESRSAALLANGVEAERLYGDAVASLGRTRQRFDLARAHLLYGEWLRRQRRRLDAREQLRTAFRMFEAMGAAAFADRASHELEAAGEAPRASTRTSDTNQLTPQEAQIARMARQGLSNPDIGTRLFISTHTVQYHLKKVFAKLGISSRSQLEKALPRDPEPVTVELAADEKS
jgi:ATP/maltotriose-dependent transcriptional regulator MalT